jgi:hypothetical protein
VRFLITLVITIVALIVLLKLKAVRDCSEIGGKIQQGICVKIGLTNDLR